MENGRGSIASVVRILEVLAPNAKRRAPERAYWGQGDKDDCDRRFTPEEFTEPVYAAFGGVDLDPCGHPSSPVVATRRFILGNGDDGLRDAWFGRFVYVNPPFSAQLRWLRLAHEQWCMGNACTIACLVPARTDSVWFHETFRADADVYFLQGRVRFIDLRGGSQATPFSLMLVVFGATAEQKEAFAATVAGFWMDRK